MGREESVVWKLLQDWRGQAGQAYQRLQTRIIPPWVTIWLNASRAGTGSIRQLEGDIDLARVERVLLVRLDEIGDVVLTLPLVRELCKALPDAHLTVLVDPVCANLFEACPFIDDLLVFSSRARSPLGTVRRYVQSREFARDRLQPGAFDLALVPRWDIDYRGAAQLAYLSGAKWRVGYSERVNERKHRWNSGLDRLFTHPVVSIGAKHELERNLDLLRFMGAEIKEDRLELWLSGADRRYALRLLSEHGIGERDTVAAFAPAAGSPARCWPIERFEWVADQLAGRGLRILVVGGTGDEPLAKRIKHGRARDVISVVGQTTLRQTAALLERCSVFVGNDTGPMHLAAAVGTPVVEISCHPVTGAANHPHSPVRFGPWGVERTILQPKRALSPCSTGCSSNRAHCIRQVRSEDVLLAVHRHLGNGS
jgi:ADP-heptose:LPS heptosyltransferase